MMLLLIEHLNTNRSSKRINITMKILQIWNLKVTTLYRVQVVVRKMSRLNRKQTPKIRVKRKILPKRQRKSKNRTR